MRATPGLIQLEGRIKHGGVGEVAVHIGVLPFRIAGHVLPQAEDGTDFHHGTERVRFHVQGILLQGALGPGGKFSVRVLPAVQGAISFNAGYILLVEAFHNQAHALRLVAAHSSQVQDHLHLLAPAFRLQKGVRDGTGFQVIVHHHVIEVVVVCAGAFLFRHPRPAVVKHDHAAGMVIGEAHILRLVRSGLRQGHFHHLFRQFRKFRFLTAGGVSGGLEVRVVGGAATAAAAPRHAVRAIAATAAVGILVARYHVILNGIGLIQEVAFSGNAASVGKTVTEGVVVRFVVHYHIRRVSGRILPVGKLIIGPTKAPGHLDITGFAKLAKDNLVHGKIREKVHMVPFFLRLGGRRSGVVNTHFGGDGSLKEEFYRAERFHVLSAHRLGHLGRHSHLTGDGAAISGRIDNSNGFRSSRDGNAGAGIIRIYLLRINDIHPLRGLLRNGILRARVRETKNGKDCTCLHKIFHDHTNLLYYTHKRARKGNTLLVERQEKVRSLNSEWRNPCADGPPATGRRFDGST